MSHKYMKPFMIFVSVVLVISLITNFNLLSKVNELENRVNSVYHTQQNIANNISGQSNQMRQVLNQFIDEQSWIGRIEMNNDMSAIDQGEAILIFTWQVKELHPDSEVEFHYAYGPSEEFISLPAEEIQQGLYQANIPIEVSLEPQWSMNYTMHEKSPASRIEKDADIKAADQQSFRYFVSVTTEDKVRNGDIQSEHLGYLGAMYYGDIITEVRLDEEYFTVNLTYHRSYESTQPIEKVYLLTYDNSTLIGEQEIEFDHLMNGGPLQFIRSDQLERNVQMQHVLRVRYSDGKIFKKEISIE